VETAYALIDDVLKNQQLPASLALVGNDYVKARVTASTLPYIKILISYDR
jgi:hypothetical protein